MGGSAYSGTLVFSEEVGMTVNVTVGGEGGKGGVGGKVSIHNELDITTEGHYSDAIFAQSIGGNGGAGGNSVAFSGQAAKSSSLNFAVAVGGNGGTGAHAGMVDIYNAGAILTTGLESNGIYAQSVGGGGGRGGNAGTILMDATESQKDSSEKNITLNASTQVGGNGGSGGNGKAVSVTNDGAITVGYQDYEDDELVESRTAFGIFAQSVGGGGGDGGSVSGYTLSVSGECTASGLSNLVHQYQCEDSDGVKSSYAPTFKMSIGGNGGSAGDGDTVTVTNNAAVTTSGTGSHAIFAQSVGGGGGNGGYGILGSTQAIAPSKTAQDVTNKLSKAGGRYSNTKQFQTLSIIIGGQGGSSGHGGSVTVTNTDKVITNGESSDAIHAQSIGGGGGSGGTAFTGVGTWLEGAVGGSGSGGGHGGDVTVSSSGTIITLKVESMGIFAQSVGGGGGRAGGVSRSLNGVLGKNLNIGKGVGFSLKAGKGGNGGDITINLAAGGGIHTSGQTAHGIFAQSIGGGGGTAHIKGVEDLALSFAGGAGDDGNGGDIDIYIDAPVNVSGDGAHGVFAQSASGNVEDGELGVDSGDVTVKVRSTVSATGTDSRGLLLQSDGLFESGQIYVKVTEKGYITTGIDGSDTIAFSDGTDNLLENYGKIYKEEDDSSTSFALNTYGGEITVENYGTMVGSVQLAAIDEDLFDATLTNTFKNHKDGQLGMGRIFDLGDLSSSLTSSGTMTAGDFEENVSTSFTGQLTQTSKGTYWADFNFEGENDLITVEDGGTATLDGFVLPIPIETVPADEATGSFTVFTAPSGMNTQGLSVNDTAIVDYTLSTTQGTDTDSVIIGYHIDYSGQVSATAAPPPFSENYYKVADYISEIASLRRQEYANGGSDYDFIEAFVLPLLRVPTLEDLANVYMHLTPADLHRNAEANLRSSQTFAGELLSCPDLSGANQFAFRYEGNCAWSQISFAQRSVSGYENSVDYDEQTWRFSTGLQSEIDDNWFLGGAFAMERVEGTTSISSSSIARFHVGAVLKHQVGNTNYAVSLSAGHSENTITREVLTGFSPTSDGFDTTNNWLAAHARVAHLFKSSQGHYFEPYADAGISWLGAQSAIFSGALPVDFAAHSNAVIEYSAEVGFSLGQSIETEKAIFDIGADFGVLSTFGSEFTSDFGFADSPSAPLELSSEDEDLVFKIGAHTYAQIGEKTSIKVNLNAQFGENETGYGADFRFSHQF